MEYSALDPSRHEIRLLHLQPGCATDPLVCTFTITSLNKDNTRPFSARDLEEESNIPVGSNETSNVDYEALSYVWGDPNNPGYVNVESNVVPVTRNLSNALHGLRYSDRERILWVDALCINQKDHTERSHQIAMMWRVYSSARQVVAYLGEEFDGYNTAVEIIQQLAADPKTHLIQSVDPTHDESEPSSSINIDGRDLSDKFLHSAFSSLVVSEWCTRTWTVQEFSLARGKVEFQYGTRSMSWHLLSNGLRSWNSHANCCCAGIFARRGGVRLLNLVGRWACLHPALDSLDFIEILELFRHRKATDPRDKVYGLLGLSSPEWGNALRPNTQIDIAELYKAVVAQSLQGERPLQFLHYCYTKSGLSLPSWVPDWSVSPGHGDAVSSFDPSSRIEVDIYKAGFQANKDILFVPRLTSSHTLTLNALGISTILYCSNAIRNGDIPNIFWQSVE